MYQHRHNGTGEIQELGAITEQTGLMLKAIIARYQIEALGIIGQRKEIIILTQAREEQ